MVALVIFDCDGVLVDSERLTNALLRDNFARYGLSMTLEETMAHFVGTSISASQDKARELGADLPENWIEGFYKELYALLGSEVQAVEGVEAVLRGLQAAKTPMAVGSNGRVEKMEITLGKTGLRDYFQGHLYSAQDIGKPKPAPDLYLKIARQFSARPEDIIVIEDSAFGAEAAFGAGMRCFGFAQETSPEKLAPYCSEIFETMAELPAVLMRAGLR